MGYHLVLWQALDKIRELQGSSPDGLGTVVSMSASRMGKPQDFAMKTCSSGVEPLCLLGNESLGFRASIDIDLVSCQKFEKAVGIGNTV